MPRNTHLSQRIEPNLGQPSPVDGSNVRQPQAWPRSLGVGLLWLASLVWLLRDGARLLPLTVARQLTVESYCIAVQLITLTVGCGMSFLILTEPRRMLGFERVRGRQLCLTVLLGPAVYVAISYAALGLALPTLREELARGGVELARSQGGAVVAAMTRTSVVTPILWAVVVSPLGEELLFRGILWGALHGLFNRRTTAAAPPELADELPLARNVLLDSLQWLVRSGSLATMVTAVIFAALHMDLKGSQAIVRVTSAVGLALACGVARQTTRSVVAPIALHVLFNALSLASARRWVVTDTFPKYYTVPTLISLAGFLGVVIVLGVWLGRRQATTARARH